MKIVTGVCFRVAEQESLVIIDRFIYKFAHNQKVVTDYMKMNQLLPFGFKLQ